MKPQLVLMRIPRRPTTPSSARTPSPSARDPVHHTGTAQWDTNHPFHLAVLESQGILQTYMLETSNGGSKAHLYPCVAFQLHLSFGGNQHESGNKCGGDTSRKDWNEEFEDGLKPIKQQWGSFEFIPERRGEIIFFQAESSRILFAQLPGGSPRRVIHSEDEENVATEINQDRSRVFCVGRHSSTILSIAIRPDGLALASAGRDGCLRIWRLSDGTMIAQTMFARWRQPRNPGIGRVSPLRRQNDEIDCAYPALRIVNFFGKSWDVAMGCPSGEARIWTQEVDEGSPLTIKSIADSATLMSGKYSISSIALHVPDCNFPLQQDEEDECQSPRLAVSFQEQLAVGTSNGELQVWTRQKSHGDWNPTWNTIPSPEGASIVCLSFRADGGLLAAAASFLARQLTGEETEALLLSSPPKKIKRVCERLYLYDTLSWGCVGTLTFSSQIGTCLFYRPQFKSEDKKSPKSLRNREKLSSCRVLLVATASGPQAHILPEYGLFGLQKDCQNRYERQQQLPASFKREAKTVRWADLKRGRNSSPSPSRDHRVRSAPAVCKSGSHAAHCCAREEFRPTRGEDFVCNSRSQIGRSEARHNASIAAEAAKSGCRSPPLRSRSRSPGGYACRHLERKPRSLVRDPYQDPSLLSLPAECLGLPMDVVMKYRASTRQGTPQVKTLNCVCCSKHARSKELPVPYPMGQVVVQNLKNVVSAKQNPSPAAVKPPARRRAVTSRVATSQAVRKSKATTSCAAGFRDTSPTYSRSVTPKSKRKPRTILSMKFDRTDYHDNETPEHEHEHESVSEFGSQLHHQDCLSLDQQQQRQGVYAPEEPTFTPERSAAGTLTEQEKEKEGVEDQQKVNGGEEEQEDAEFEEEFHNESCPLSDADSHPHTAEQHEKHHHYHQQPIIGGKKLYAMAVNQHRQREEENICDWDRGSRNSPKHLDMQDGATSRYSSSNDDSPAQTQLCTDRSRPQVEIGGENLPDKQIVGGNDLEDFLVEERSPFRLVGSDVREMATERKLVQPEPFSTAKLMARLQEIEQETFSVEAALQVAKLRGIELDDTDEKGLRKALEEESKLQMTHDKHNGPGLKSRKQSVRYTQLTKISDPRVLRPGPFLAARKVRKQVDPKWEDMRTMKPALSDLWDLKERYAQVSSFPQEYVDHNVMCVGVHGGAEDSQLYAQIEATCRHAWNSQALYDGCLYKPDRRDPRCACNVRVHSHR